MSGEDSHVVELAVYLFAVGLFIGVLSRYLSKLFSISLPYTVIILLVGIVLGELSEHLGDFGEAVEKVRDIDPHFLLSVFIPGLIFESAFASSYHIISIEFYQSLLLAGPGVIINVSLVATFVRYVLPYDWGWDESIMFGAIASATDPVAVVALLSELGASKKLATLIEGESLLNDGTAFVLYTIALEFVKDKNPSGGEVFGDFLRLTFGGVFVGVVLGILCMMWLMNVLNDAKIEICITIFACYLAFYIAEYVFVASGVLACVFLGLILSKYKLSISPSVEHSLHHVWEIMNYISNTLIFLFSGIIIVEGYDSDAIEWSDVGYAILIYLFIHVSRMSAILILWYPLNLLGYKFTWKDGYILWFAGLRGVIGLALALITTLETLPDTTSKHLKDRIMFHSCAVVLLTLIINATLIKYLIKCLRMDRNSDTSDLILKDAMDELRESTNNYIVGIKDNINYSGADWKIVFSQLPKYDTCVSPLLYEKTKEAASSSIDESEVEKGCIDYFVDLIFCQYCAQYCCKECYDNLQKEFEYTRKENALRKKMKSQFKKEKEGQLLKVKSGGDDETKMPTTSTMNLKRFGRDEEKEVTHDDDHVEDEEMKKQQEAMVKAQLVRRVLCVLKANYMACYEEGLITQESEMILLDAVETALDCNDLQTQFNILRQVFDIPKWLLKFYSFRNCHRLSKQLLFLRLSTAVEVGSVFIRTFNIVKKEFVHEIPSSVSYFKVVEKVLDELEAHCMEIRKSWLNIQSSYGEVYHAIQTRLATNHIIHHEEHLIEELKEEGLLEDNEYQKLSDVVLKALNKIHNPVIDYFIEGVFASIIYDDDDAEINKIEDKNGAFLGLHWMQRFIRANNQGNDKDEKENIEFILENSTLNVVNEKDIIFEAGGKPNGVIVIVRGSGCLTDSSGKLTRTIGVGYTFAFNYLANENYRYNFMAETPLEYYSIGDAIMKQLINKNSSVLDALWQTCASNLIQSQFRSNFNETSLIDISSLCRQSPVWHANKSENKMIGIEHDALILKGNCVQVAKANGGAGDSVSVGHQIDAPAMLNGNGFNFQFSDDAVVLKFNTIVHGAATVNKLKIKRPRSPSHSNNNRKVDTQEEFLE